MNKSNVANDVDNTTLYTCDKKLPGVQIWNLNLYVKGSLRSNKKIVSS